jgi:hypothetical protein
MPAVAAGASIYAGISTFLATTVVGSVTVGSLLATTALTGASYALQRASAKKAARGSGGVDNSIDKQVVKQSLPPARLIYGRALVGGALFLVEREGNYLYYGLLIADHEIDAIEQVRMGDRTVSLAGTSATSIPYYDGTNTYLFVSVGLGTDAQLIDPILAADFPTLPTTFRQRGVARVVLKMYQPLTISADLNRLLYGNAGQPAPLFLVRGKKVFDPADPSQTEGVPATYKWSDSNSLCAADVTTLPRKRGGGGAAWSEIDLEALALAASHDRTPVPLKSGGTELRYTCNGVVDLTGTPPGEIVQSILTGNHGARVTSNGKFVFLSGVPRVPVWTLNDHSARGSMNAVLETSLSDVVNIVRTTFVSLDRSYQLVEGPELRNDTFITEDGAEMPFSLELPFTTSHSTAQRLANIMMLESRQGRRVSRNEDLAAILLDAGDVVNLESNVLTAANGQYVVEHVGVADTPMEFSVSLRGYSPAIYDWTPATQEQDFAIAPPDLS